MAGGIEYSEVLEIPKRTECTMKALNYNYLDEDGLVPPGQRVSGDGAS